MNANELRIGNWVNTGRLRQVTPHEIGFINDGGTVALPIPLTPEILEKAGFKMKDEGYLLTLDTVVEINQICIEYDWSVSIGDVNANGFFASNIGICQYVHQLQNLYFALTGTELNIEL